MADQILNAIIQLENRIEQQLRLEQEKATAWLAGVRGELEANAKRDRQWIADRKRQLMREAEQQIDSSCTRLLDAEMSYCRRLKELSEETLLEVLRRQLERIIPRPVDDHQDGKN
ncbi:hypothetical protein [Malonomonas rubra]|uniref:hypothetical protein n=1 Tax=Malonomonas rubra TaxID=57040 RepID=UPI0026EA4D23|nr:hypothetical protein [Malonomonas rubra]